MFLYVKKYLFSFLNRFYRPNNNALLAVCFGTCLIQAFCAIILLLLKVLTIRFHKEEEQLIAISWMVFDVLLLSFSTLIVTDMLQIGKNKIESVNKNIEGRLEILNNKKLLELKIKNCKIKNNGKKYL